MFIWFLGCICVLVISPPTISYRSSGSDSLELELEIELTAAKEVTCCLLYTLSSSGNIWSSSFLADSSLVSLGFTLGSGMFSFLEFWGLLKLGNFGRFGIFGLLKVSKTLSERLTLLSSNR